MPDNRDNENQEQNNKQNKAEQNQGQASSSLNDATVLEMLPAFVLGALEADEMLAIESYVNQHPALSERLTALEAATDQLAYAAPYAALPSHIKTQLMHRVRADLAARSMRPMRPGANPFIFPPSRRVAPKPSARIQPATPVHPQPRNWFGWVARTLIGVSVAAALLLLAVSTVQLRSTATRLAAELTAIKTQLTQLQTKNSDLQNVNQLLQQQLQSRNTQIALLTSPHAEIVLAGTKDAPSATGTFYIHDNNGVLVLHGLPPLPPDQAYQLWFIPAVGSPVPSGVIQVANAMPNTLTVVIPAEGQNFAKLGVTIEPKIGSKKPTGLLVLLGLPT